MGTHVKTRCCQVQINNMQRIWGGIGKYFHADELHYPKTIKEEYRSALIFEYICVLGQCLYCEYKFSPDLETSEPEIYDMLWMRKLPLLYE